MNRKALIFGGIAVVLVGAVFASKLMRGDGAREVDTTAAEVKVIRSSILASGQLAYREQVQLGSEVIGKALRVPFEEGDHVSAGDIIVALDPEQYRSLVEQQETNVRMQEIAIERQQVLLESMERRVQRQRDLFERALVDTNSYELAENELALARVDLRSRQEALSQARATLAQARDNLAKTEIRSPIDGMIIQLDVKPGEAVIAGTTNIPGSTLAVIADTSVMLTEVNVDEADIAQVQIGQSASIFPAAFPDTALPGIVETIATSAQRALGQQNLSFEVRIRLTEPDRVAVRPGMTCRAEIHTESSEGAVAVPLQAVLYDDDARSEDRSQGSAERAHVFVVDDGRARRREVTLGLSSDSDMEIVSGLSAGERVVSGPFRVLRHLRDGDPVRVSDRD